MCAKSGRNHINLYVNINLENCIDEVYNSDCESVLWLERENVWCLVPVHQCSLEICVNKNCQTGVHAQCPAGTYLGAPWLGTSMIFRLESLDAVPTCSQV